MIKKTIDWSSGFWFGSVGAVSALVHMTVFALMRHTMNPEWANVFGFTIAFAVSYWGHRWLSFKDTTTSTSQNLPRFAITALAGFASNELCFMAFVYGFDWSVWPALVLAMVIAAGQTYLLSRWWAFRR